MDYKCDKCDRRATHRSVEIIKGKKVEKHLCDLHAAEEGLLAKTVHTPINELLTNFVKLHSGETRQDEFVCEHCGMTFNEFREHSLLGCPKCYEAFEVPLSPLMERAHEGATHHVGKVPQHSEASEQRQRVLLRLRKRLTDAVEAENYELAASLRDEISKHEKHPT